MRGPHQFAADVQVGRWAARSQLANAPMNHSSARRSSASSAGGCRTAPRMAGACRLKASGQCGSSGSGSSSASSTAREEASGRRAHQMERGRMPVPDRLLPRRVPGHLGDRKVDLGQPPARSGNHDTTITDDRLYACSATIRMRTGVATAATMPKRAGLGKHGKRRRASSSQVRRSPPAWRRARSRCDRSFCRSHAV